MTKITVYYADDIYDAHKYLVDNRSTNGDLRDIHQNQYYGVQLSKRIDWTQEQCLKALLDLEEPTVFITNDYHFMRLIQEFAGSEFSIYHVDEDKTVYDFVDLKPNYALEIGHHIFVWSARKALKQV